MSNAKPILGEDTIFGRCYYRDEDYAALEAENARLERLVGHWQGLAVTNRKVADDALAQLAAIQGGMGEVVRYWHKPGIGFAVLDPQYYEDESGYVAYEDYAAMAAEVETWRSNALMLEQANAGLAQLNGKLRAELAEVKGREAVGEVQLRTGGGISLLHVDLTQPLPPGTKLYASPPAAQQEQHPDDQAVDRFAVAMKVKLAKSREKGRHGWQTASAAHLSGLLYRHMYKADPLDVANLAMMLHQNGQAIELPHEARHDQGEVRELKSAPSGEREAAVEAAYAAVVEGGWSSVKEMGVEMFQAGAAWQRAQAAPVSKAERLPLESLEFVKRPVPSGWAVKRPAIDARYVDNYLGPLEGWLEDPRRAVLFGNREAAIAAQAALSVDSLLPIFVVWLVYDEVLGNYREQAQ